MKVTRISIPRQALDRLSPEHRDFFLLAGHIQNEINVLHKTFACCLNTSPETDRTNLESLADGMQAMIFARTLAGKLSEAWAAVQRGWNASKLSLMLEARLHQDAREAIEKLKKYFGRKNTINTVRNSFAFHYSIEALGNSWNRAVDERFDLVLGGTIGNNLNLGSELFANAALLESFAAPDFEHAARTLFEDVQSIASCFVTFLEGVSVATLNDTLGASWSAYGRDEEVNPSRSLSTVNLPFFHVPEIVTPEKP